MSRRLTVFPPLSPKVYTAPRQPLPFPLDQERCGIFELGRHGLWHGLRSAGLDSGTVLVPTYHHGSEIEVLQRAGLKLRWYDIDDSLAPRLDDADVTDVRALYLIHYLGFPQDAASWRKWCDERGLLLIEDVAQGWLGSNNGTPLGSWGDIAIFCLYKQLGVPDGGAVLTASTIESHPPRGLGLARLVRRHVAWATARSDVIGKLSPRVVDRPKDEVAAEDFEVGDLHSAPLKATRYLLPRLCEPEVAQVRREHYRFFLDRLGDLVAPGFDRLPEETSPFAFPIAVADKDALYHYLVDRMILPQDLWAIPHPSLNGDFPAAARRRATTIALPVHHDLRRSDLEWIVRVVRSGLSSVRST
ncbi:MAG TPA: DegT/DnrJ/EryC1/StrS family aminotransferase [Actinomycetota bacterium]|nr:DegT/DnrJ/EryC1/StrS family aminotransferase [Actinomycetota bacterium]